MKGRRKTAAQPQVKVSSVVPPERAQLKKEPETVESYLVISTNCSYWIYRVSLSGGLDQDWGPMGLLMLIYTLRETVHLYTSISSRMDIFQPLMQTLTYQQTHHAAFFMNCMKTQSTGCLYYLATAVEIPRFYQDNWAQGGRIDQTFYFSCHYNLFKNCRNHQCPRNMWTAD